MRVEVASIRRPEGKENYRVDLCTLGDFPGSLEEDEQGPLPASGTPQALLKAAKRPLIPGRPCARFLNWGPVGCSLRRSATKRQGLDLELNPLRDVDD